MAKKTILIVDDESININILFDALEPEYDIVVAKNGEQALKRATTLLPDLILLDILMPEMDGYEVCRQLKSNESTKQIPVIFLTAMSDTGYETKGLDMGAVDYIVKPINTPIVKSRVKHHLEREEYKHHLEELVAARTRELEIAKLAAEEANSAKSNFLMNVGHELRTPLNAVLVCAEMITKDESLDEIVKLRDMIKSSGHVLLNSVERIIEFTRSKDGKLTIKNEPFQLGDAILGIQTEFYHKGKKKQLIPSIKGEGDDIPVNLIGDHQRLTAILNPLLENAAKFAGEKPEAVLSLKTLEKTEDEVVIRFVLSDSGIGIDPKHMETIFEPFHQVDGSSTREFDGIGMGLPICKQFVELMGGEIRVESELGKGSVFSFTARFGLQNATAFLDISAINSALQKKACHESMNAEGLSLDVSTVRPLFKNLSKALLESNPNHIQKYLSEVTKYQIPKKDELIRTVTNYEYDAALSALKGIAAEIGLQLE